MRLEARPRTNAHCETRADALSDAIRAGDRQEAVRLIEAGADVNATDPLGTTALMWAARYGDAAPRTDARFALFAGAKNRCFLPESQERTYEFLQRHRPGKDSLHVLPGYGHLDPFFGKNADNDVFPQFLAELARGA